jgi:hypothetical protein
MKHTLGVPPWGKRLGNNALDHYSVVLLSLQTKYVEGGYKNLRNETSS